MLYKPASDLMEFISARIAVGIGSPHISAGLACLANSSRNYGAMCGRKPSISMTISTRRSFARAIWPIYRSWGFNPNRSNINHDPAG